MNVEPASPAVIAWMAAWIERNPVKHARYLRRLNTKPRRRDHRGRFAREV
jgi:hypothetical protein